MTPAVHTTAVPDLMAGMEAFTRFDAAALGRSRKTNEVPPRVSVYDLIGCVTGQDASNSKHYWDRLVVAHPEVLVGNQNLKFPGRGQRGTPVADARGAVEIIMLLPGKVAATFRKEAASVIVRYIGGDMSLVDEVAANRLAQEHIPDTHPARFFGQAVESEQKKRLREEIEVTEIQVRLAETQLRLVESQGQHKRARISEIESGFQAMTSFGVEIGDREKLMAKDVICTMIFMDANTPVEQDHEVSIKQMLLAQGLNRPGLDCLVGKLAKSLYLGDHPTYVFVKKDILCNGQVVKANVWRESQKSYIENAIAQLT